MPDKVKTETAEKQVKTAPKTAVDHNNKVSLVELIMILMLVGLVFVFFFGMQQLKVDKATEAIAQTKFEAILPTFQKIIDGMESYRKADEFGDYPTIIDGLNLGTIDTPDFKFEYVFDTLTITATSQAAFGKADVKVNYSIKDKSYTVDDPAPEKKPTVKDEWLPQE
ncbi:MAG: hypothetical protein RBS43_00485 [Candidatus Cloacimonas sp.]|jgi:hypothetical protein|nr:hypothetical protein [Candidatus Cloacimonas sp.]